MVPNLPRPGQSTRDLDRWDSPEKLDQKLVVSFSLAIVLRYSPNATSSLEQPIRWVFEGVVPYELFEMLKSFMSDKKYFSLHVLNDHSALYAYSMHEATDKPSLLLSLLMKLPELKHVSLYSTS